MPLLTEQDISRITSELGLVAGIPITANQIKGGRNNQAFLLESGRDRYFVKKYFNDSKPRLQRETLFLTALNSRKSEFVPNLLASVKDLNLAIFEYVDGFKLGSNMLEKEHVESAKNFIQECIETGENTDLPIIPGAESCFSVDEHVNLICSRLDVLDQASASSPQLKAFLDLKLRPQFNLLTDSISSNKDVIKRFLSPSDFGFHNALLSGSQVVFVDFEHAGWDDPAKMICDFFWQPEIPVSLDHLEGFVALFDSFDPPSRKRVSELIPLYGVKWCCILLNDFLHDGIGRRGFSGDLDPVTLAARQTHQLEKAEQYCYRISRLSKELV